MTCDTIWVDGTSIQTARTIIETKIVHIALLFLQSFGKYSGPSNKMAYEHVIASAVVRVLKILPIDVARIYVSTLNRSTTSRESHMPSFSVIVCFTYGFHISLTTSVALPSSSPTAVDTSAAHKPASVRPATTGLKVNTTVGSAIAAFFKPGNFAAVSYTHLTLPTIYSV